MPYRTRDRKPGSPGNSNRAVGPHRMCCGNIAYCLPLAVGLLVAVASASTMAETRVAILGEKDTGIDAIVALTEVQAGKLPNVALVERNAIDLILKEQQLQAAFSADGLASRKRLGRLLGADVLVLVKGVADPSPHVVVVVCETQRGLRLRTRLVHRSEAGKDVATVLATIADGLKKHGQRVQEVVAVPPFVSKDLDIERQTLQRPLSRLVEQVLLDRPGVLVVELAESRAIADELRLQGETGVDRELPVYLLGEFRHDQYGPAANVSLSLVLKRGDRVLARRQMKNVPKAQVGDSLRRDLRELFDKVLSGNEVSPGHESVPDVKAEVGQLNHRASMMYRFSSWSEAADLAEASLLLNPEQVTMHRLAAEAIRRHVRKLCDAEVRKAAPSATRRKEFVESVCKKHAVWYARGAPHLEYYLTHARIAMGNDYPLVAGYLERHPDERAMREMMLRVFKENLRRKQASGGDRFAPHCQQWCFTDCSEAERLAWNLEAARHWPGTRMQSVYYLVKYRVDLKTTQQWREVGEMLQDAPSAAARELAEWIRQQLDRGTALGGPFNDPGRANVVGKVPPPGPRPLPSAETDVKFEETEFPRRVTGYLPGVPGLDIAWSKIRESPVLETRQEGNVSYHPGMVRVLPGKHPAGYRDLAEVVVSHFGNPICYDGRYIWGFQNSRERFPESANGADKPTPRMVVVDPRTSKHWFILPKHGVPPMPVRNFTVAPLGVGRVCAVGIVGPSGEERAWIARISVDTTGRDGHDAKVFHEAGERILGQRIQDGNPKAAFFFGVAFTVSEKPSEHEQPRRRVVVDRRSNRPLVIDPETLSVRVGDGFTFAAYPSRHQVHDGTLYWIGKVGHNHHVWRYGFPELKPRRSEHTVPQGILHIANDRFYIFSTKGEFWVAEKPFEPFERLSTPAWPAKRYRGFLNFGMFSTQHYGEVMREDILLNRVRVLFRVLPASVHESF